MLLVITALMVTSAPLPSRRRARPVVGNGGSAWSIMIHDLVYLGFGLFALYLAPACDSIASSECALAGGLGIGLLLAVRAVGVTSNGGKRG